MMICNYLITINEILVLLVAFGFILVYLAFNGIFPFNDKKKIKKR